MIEYSHYPYYIIKAILSTTKIYKVANDICILKILIHLANQQPMNVYANFLSQKSKSTKIMAVFLNYTF